MSERCYRTKPKRQHKWVLFNLALSSLIAISLLAGCAAKLKSPAPIPGRSAAAPLPGETATLTGVFSDPRFRIMPHALSARNGNENLGIVGLPYSPAEEL